MTPGSPDRRTLLISVAASAAFAVLALAWGLVTGSQPRMKTTRSLHNRNLYARSYSSGS